MAFVSFLLTSGGPVVAVLLLFSVAALAVVLWKLAFWWRTPLSDPAAEAALAALERGERAAARRALEGAGTPRARLVAEGLRLAVELGERDLLRQELERRARRRWLAALGQLRILEAVAGAAPLLGLFGTVLGMIEAFAALERAGSAVDPALLAGGIWEALLTTAVGLAVALPASLAHGFLEGRAEALAERLSDDLGRLLAALERPAAPVRAEQVAP